MFRAMNKANAECGERKHKEGTAVEEKNQGFEPKKSLMSPLQVSFSQPRSTGSVGEGGGPLRLAPSALVVRLFHPFH